MHDLVKELLANRFVTVKGAGGIGKTTLAVEVARWFHSRGHFPDGVFQVDLRQAGTAWRSSRYACCYARSRGH